MPTAGAGDSGRLSAPMASPLSDLRFRNDPVQIDKYTLLTRLASGGMGEVYVARMSAAAGFEKQVVIKRLLPELARDEQFVKLFLEEARLTARLSHPNICQVFELTAIEDEYFLVMEYLEGLSLSALFHSYDGEGLDLRIATGLITQACEGLQYAHDFRDIDNGVQGIVHRDVSPHNLMLTVSGVVKLLDFGVAKLRREGHHTVTGSAKGKYAYMAPEQLHCQDLDRRADLFAIAVVLFELITGQRLFRRRSELATMKAIVDGDRPMLHDVRADVPRELSDIVDRTLSVDREKRFASARAFTEAIRSAMAPLGGPAPLSELAEYVRERHAEALNQQRMLIRNATDRVPKVDPDDLEATTIKPPTGSHPRAPTGSHPRQSSSQPEAEPIRRRLPLRPPTVTRAVDSLIDADGFEYEDATVLDSSTAGALEAERISRRQIVVQPRPPTGSDISIELSYKDSRDNDAKSATDLAGQVASDAPMDSLSELAGALAGDSAAHSLHDLDAIDLRPKRRGRWIPVAGLLVAVAVALFFWRQQSGNDGAPGAKRTIAAASTVADPGAKDDPTIGARAGAHNGTSGRDNPSAQVPATDAQPHAGPPAKTELRVDAGASAAAGAAATDGVKPDGDKRDKKDNKRRRRRRDRDKKSTSAANGFGYLTIDASPYAEIYIDGRKMGITPLVRVKLSAGEHKIRAKSAKGSKRVRVKIGKDKTTKKRIVF